MLLHTLVNYNLPKRSGSNSLLQKRSQTVESLNINRFGSGVSTGTYTAPNLKNYLVYLGQLPEMAPVILKNLKTGFVEADEGKIINPGEIEHDSNYDKLEAVSDLLSVRESVLTGAKQKIARPSYDTLVQTTYMAMEVGMHNINRLLKFATIDIQQGRYELAAKKILGIQGLNTIMHLLSRLPQTTSSVTGIPNKNLENTGQISILHSPTFQELLTLRQSYDQAVLQKEAEGDFSMESVFLKARLADTMTSLFQLDMVSNIHTENWEHNLTQVFVHNPEATYQNFVQPDKIKEVLEAKRRNVEGDIYMPFFNSFHQIAELLGYEVRDHMNQTFKLLNNETPNAPPASVESLRQAIEHLEVVNKIIPIILEDVPKMSTVMDLSQYHSFRPVFAHFAGSGSHVFLQEFFGRLPKTLAQVLSKPLEEYSIKTPQNAKLEDILHQVDQHRFDPTDEKAWLLSKMASEAQTFWFNVTGWQMNHLHVARVFEGAPFGARVLKRRTEGRREANPLQFVVQGRKAPPDIFPKPNPFLMYTYGPSSLDHRVSQAIGRGQQTVNSQNQIVQDHTQNGPYDHPEPPGPDAILPGSFASAYQAMMADPNQDQHG